MAKENMKKLIAAIISVLIFGGVIGFAFIPSLVTAIDNGNANECHHNAFLLMNKLGDFLNGTEDNKIWYDLIQEKNSKKLLNALNEQLDKRVDISNYYVKYGDGDVAIMCRQHPQVLDVTMVIPDNLISNQVKYKEPKSNIIMSITASGRDTYFQNSILDYNDQDKMVFTNEDDLNRLLPDIKVTAHFAGGGIRELRPDEYKIQVGKLDMTKSGKKIFRITYTGQDWQTNLFTSFEIYVLDNEQREPLVVDGGNFGTYELASWIWTDYVADALNADGNYMDFDASIVFDEGKYYYYPDGFSILKDNKNNGTIKGAVDISNHKKQAYYIEFNTKKIINNNKVSLSSLKDGYLKVGAQDKVYIWQTVASKELPKGWIEVYCEKTKLK